MWKIERVISKGDYNYALIPGHPNVTANGYVLEHRVVIENYLGRFLYPHEIVHHKNGNRKDNRIENLEIKEYREHNRDHRNLMGRTMVELLCPVCKAIFVKRRNHTHLLNMKKRKYLVTCCSNRCRGVLYSQIQYHGITAEVEKAISENVRRVYRDNSEQTV